MAASFRPGKLTGIEILSRLFPLQKRDVLELVLQGCNGDAMKAIEHFLSADDGVNCDVSLKQVSALSKGDSTQDENVKINEVREHSCCHVKEQNKSASFEQKQLNNKERSSALPPLNLNWDFSSRTDLYPTNWGSFSFGPNLLQNDANQPRFSHSFYRENQHDSVLSCFSTRTSLMNQQAIPPLYYPMSLPPPNFK